MGSAESEEFVSEEELKTLLERWMAPGPSAVLPSPSLGAPTRIAILPRCLFSYMS